MMGSPLRPTGGLGVSNITVEPDSELDSLHNKIISLVCFACVSCNDDKAVLAHGKVSLSNQVLSLFY